MGPVTKMLLMLGVGMFLLCALQIDTELWEEGPLVWLSHGGALRGVWSRAAGGRRFKVFQGIPYARPPVGRLRFAPPEAAVRWYGERRAACEGPVCPQPSVHPFLVSCPSRVPAPSLVWSWLLHLPRLVSLLARRQREDCLFVNVYTPASADTDLDENDNNASLPVLVWLHGGAFLIGDGSALEYGPELLMDHDIILITLNYRLGVLGMGFLYGGPDSGAPGNVGLRDQALALLWVRDNVEAFGGDPRRVTLWGESAGAVSAHLQTMATTSGQGLFQQLILSSGVAVLPWALQEEPLASLQTLADVLGWRDRRRPDHPRDLVRFLRKVPVEQMVIASNDLNSVMSFVGNGMRLLQWLPVVEEQSSTLEQTRFLVQNPLTTLNEGIFRSVPTMLGVNSREGLVWLAGKGPRAVDGLLQRINRNFSLVVCDLPFVWHQLANQQQEHRPPTAAQVHRAAHLIRGFFFGRQSVGVGTLPAFLDLYSDLIFNIGIREAIALHLRWAPTPLYLYRFSFDGQLGFLKRLIDTTVSGVGHADELGYLFNMKVLPTIFLPHNSAETLTRQRLISLWINFVKNGNPTPNQTGIANSIMWQQNSVESDVYLDIGTNLTLRTNMFEQRMDFWRYLYREVLERPLSW